MYVYECEKQHDTNKLMNVLPIVVDAHRSLVGSFSSERTTCCILTQRCISFTRTYSRSDCRLIQFNTAIPFSVRRYSTLRIRFNQSHPHTGGTGKGERESTKRKTSLIYTNHIIGYAIKLTTFAVGMFFATVQHFSPFFPQQQRRGGSST